MTANLSKHRIQIWDVQTEMEPFRGLAPPPALHFVVQMVCFLLLLLPLSDGMFSEGYSPVSDPVSDPLPADGAPVWWLSLLLTPRGCSIWLHAFPFLFLSVFCLFPLALFFSHFSLWLSNNLFVFLPSHCITHPNTFLLCVQWNAVLAAAVRWSCYFLMMLPHYFTYAQCGISGSLWVAPERLNPNTNDVCIINE